MSYQSLLLLTIAHNFLGGGVTLTELINLLKDNSKTSGLEYAERVATHLERVANVSVRNVS